jgi:hypothetical protein
MSATVAWRARAARLDDAEGDIAGAAGDVEHGEAAVAGRVERRPARPSRPVQLRPTSGRSSGRSARDRVEDVVDQPCLSASGTSRKPKSWRARASTPVEARRGDLRWPLPKDFAMRLQGRTVTGLGRRAKYLLADLSSGDVLFMHLGMSGSFRVARRHGGIGRRILSRALEKPRARPRRLPMSSGATITFNDPRRFGFMKLVPRARLDDEPMLRALGPEPLGNEFDAAMLARACAGKKTSSRPR